MAINLSALAPLTTAATSLSNLILVSPQATVGYQPQNQTVIGGITQTLSQQPPAILFHYEGEQTVALESDITDHYVEDNKAVQDQIALKPIRITTHGFIGELNDVPPFGLQTLKTAADKLQAITAYAPEASVTAQLAYSEAFLAYQVGANAVNAAVSSWSSLGNAISGSNGQAIIGGNGSLDEGSNQNKQQTAFQQFYGYWQNRVLFTVQTPWAVFEDMAIVTLRAIQDAETNVITDFEVTFKMIRKASTSFGSSGSLAGRAATQAADLVNQGTSSGTPSESVGTGISQTENPQ